MLIVSTNMYSQSCLNIFPGTGNAGIHIYRPFMPLDITDGCDFTNPLICPEITIRLAGKVPSDSSQAKYASFISLRGDYSPTIFSTVPSHGVGDLVICSRKDIGHEMLGGNIILTTHDITKSIIFATTSPNSNNEYERQKIYPDGTIDFNVGQWEYGLPKIQFKVSNAMPTIRLYQPYGDDVSYNAHSYPWWIEGYGTELIDYLNFKGGGPAKIGQEYVKSIFTLKTLGSDDNSFNGFVGVNNTDPRVKFQVTNGTVVFNGVPDALHSSEGDLPTLQNDPLQLAGTRFEWVPNFASIRAGVVDGNQWVSGYTIGYASAAFGSNNTASGSFTMAAGLGNTASGNYSSAFGASNEASGLYSTAFGITNRATGLYATSFGWDNSALGQATVAFGHQNVVEGDICIAIGDHNHAYNSNCIVIGNFSIAGDNGGINNYNDFAIGNQVTAVGTNTQAFGNNTEASGANSTAMGNYVSNNGYNGSFIIGDKGDNNSFYKTPNTNHNQIILRFTGNSRPDTLYMPSDSNIVFKIITETNTGGGDLNGIFTVRGNNGWYYYSDRNLKKDINPVNENDILKRLRLVKINTWKWKDHWDHADTNLIWDNFSYTWMGPMAQDFYKQFPLGIQDSTKLSEATMMSATMAGVQELANISDTLRNTDSIINTKIDSVNNMIVYESNKIDTINNIITNQNVKIDSLNYSFINLKNTNDSLVNIINIMQSNTDSLKNIIDRYKVELDTINKTNIELKMRDSILEEKINLLLSSNNYQDCYADIILEQNNPNPFSETSVITYYVPSKYGNNTQLVITDANGQNELQTYSVTLDVPTQITISSQNLTTGIYIYGIKYNGVIVKSKKLMVIK